MIASGNIIRRVINSKSTSWCSLCPWCLVADPDRLASGVAIKKKAMMKPSP